jgi:uncharacterized RDD family membrane protein YckC
VAETDELLSIDTPENVVFDYEIVGIGSRFIAALVDSLLLALILLLVNVTAILVLSNLFDLARGWVLGIFTAFSFLSLWGYYILFELLWNGQSPGKRWAGLRVIRRDGTPITLVESLIRNLVRFVDFLPVAYGAGIVTMFIHPQSCRLGDLAAGTLVVRDGGALALADLSERPVLRGYLSPVMEELVGSWPLDRLTPADLQLARDFMQRRQSLANQNTLALAILRRLQARMELPAETVHPADAQSALASIVNASKTR